MALSRFLAVFAVCLFGITANASAVTPAVTINTRTPMVEDADDGASEIALTFTNLTEGTVQLSATPADRSACVLGLDKSTVKNAESKAVKVSIPAPCKASEGLVIEVAATSGGSELASFEVVPEVAPAEDSEWDNLGAFPIAWVLILAALGLFFLKGWKPAGDASHGLSQRVYLDATWKFNDNWATNVSAIGAILTGVFGATTTKAFLGDDAESAVALATVGAAIALALVAAGPVIALATKTFKTVAVVDGDGNVMNDEDGKPVMERADSFTVGGLLLASSVIFASAFGQLWVVMATGEELDLGGFENYLWIPFGLAAILLFVYGWRSLKDLLERNTARPASEDADEVKAARLIVAALEGKAPGVEAADGEGVTVAGVKDKIAVEKAIASISYAQRQRSVLP